VPPHDLCDREGIELVLTILTRYRIPTQDSSGGVGSGFAGEYSRAICSISIVVKPAVTSTILVTASSANARFAHGREGLALLIFDGTLSLEFLNKVPGSVALLSHLPRLGQQLVIQSLVVVGDDTAPTLPKKRRALREHPVEIMHMLDRLMAEDGIERLATKIIF